jgi:chromosome segregation ATPase
MISKNDTPSGRRAAQHRAAAAEAERAVIDLRDRRAELAAELEETGENTAHADFSAFRATGELATKSRMADAARAEIEQVDAMIAAGELQIEAALRHAKDADRKADQEWAAAMKMADAVDYARDALRGIDLDAAAADFDELETQLVKLHEPRLKARDAFAAAEAREADLLRRYRGRPDPRDGLTPERAKAASTEALAGITRLRDRAEALRRRHGYAKEDLNNRVKSAFSHVGRLAEAAASLAEAHAKSVAVAASALSRGRLSPSMLPTAPEIELPSKAVITELSALAEPALVLARRELPPQRSESEYSAPRLY